jgi:Ca2+-binding RTX toxin-like protein
VEFDQSANTFTLNVSPVNDAPVLDLDSGAGGTGAAAAYTEAAAPTQMAPAATVTDVDSVDFSGGSLTVTFTANGTPADQLTVRNVGTGAGQIGVSGVNVSYAGTAIGSFSGGTNGSDLVITLNSNATAAAVQELARNISFSNNSPAPSTLARSVSVTLVDGDGNANSGSDTASATATITVSSINDAPTGSVTIGGTATQGQTLTASNTLADGDGLGTITYQWQADGVDIGGATASTLLLGQAQVGKVITVLANYTDAGGAAESVASGATAAVVNINDVPTGSVTISGTTTEGQTLTASNTLADPDGLGAITYQWQAGGVDIGGETASTLLLTQAQVGKTITVVASYTDLGGAAESVPSSATASVANLNQAPTGSVTISGTATQGQTLTASNTLADTDGLGTISYQWQADGADIVGATDTSLLLTQAQVGTVITVLANYTDDGSQEESIPSAGTTPVANVNDPHTGGAAITGTAAEDQVLNAVSTLADIDGLGTLHYQWQHDVGSGFVNVGADQATYTLGDADIGGVVRVVISYTDQQGTAESATSAATGEITSTNDAPTGGVSITGTATEDQVLTADTSALADSDGLGTLHYQWQRDTGSGFANVGADQATYSLGDADVGGAVRVVVSYTDGQGFSNSATSSATSAVGNVNDVPTGTVTISGSLIQGRALTAANTLADVDGLGAITYQWRADGTDIGGATGSTYALTASDVGKAITVVASYTDQQGTAEAVSSAATAAIAADADAPVVVTFNPADDNTAVPLGSDISFTFNELIVAGTGNIVLQTVSGTVVETYDAATSINLLFSGETLTIDPSAALDPGVAYRVVFDAASVLDLAGNAFAGAPDYNFATSSEPVTGGRGSDILIGGPGDDQLDGGKGRDTMIGAQGNDTYYVDRKRDVVIEEPNAGTDQVFASSSYVLGANVENLTLTGDRSSRATGNELDNVLVGNDSRNKLVGALGADTLTGGLGSDRFVLLAEGDSPATAGEWDVITDFNEMERDRIDLRRVDADVLESGNQRFTWIGTASFGADATGQLRFDSATHMLYGSTDADANAEIAIELVGVTSLDVHSIMR